MNIIEPSDLAEYFLIGKMSGGRRFFGRSFAYQYMISRISESILRCLGRELDRLHTQNRQGVIKILDIGCREGALIFDCQSLFENRQRIEYTGIDLAPHPIAFANRKREYFGIDNCSFKVMDAQKLEFIDDEFDIVISSELIEHIEDPKIVFQEIKRVLKPTGYAVITTPNIGKFRLSKLINLMLFKIPSKIHDKIMDNYESKYGLWQKETIEKGIGYGHISVKPPNEWAVLVKEFGFKIEKISGTGGLVLGDLFLDSHKFIFGLLVILDVLLSYLPGTTLWSESTLMELRK